MTSKSYCDPILVDGSNRFAWSLVQVVARHPGIYGPLYLYGDSGVGKTQMLRRIQYEMRMDDPNRNVLYTTADELTLQLVRAFVQHNREAFMQKLQRVDLLLIDDLQCLAGMEATQEEFARFFETLYVQGKQIIITSDRHERELIAFDGYFQRHLGGILSAEILEPGPEVRYGIVQRECYRLGVELTEDVCRYLAGQATNPCKVLGLVRRVVAYYDLEKLPLDVDRVYAYIKDIL